MGLKELSHPGERDKLTVVQRVLQITQDSTHLGHSGLIFLSFDVSALSPAGLQHLIANVLNLVLLGKCRLLYLSTDLTDGAALLGLSDPWDPDFWEGQEETKGIWGAPSVQLWSSEDSGWRRADLRAAEGITRLRGNRKTGKPQARLDLGTAESWDA